LGKFKNRLLKTDYFVGIVGNFFYPFLLPLQKGGRERIENPLP
jgi:hypothetical protein